ncbi:MAG: rhodanese-like domain-containing protein [Actinomycetes bacterium]
MTIIPEITVDEIDPQFVLLDVREADEWVAGRAPAARHLALSELAEAEHGFEPGQRVQVICKVGGRSARATAFLRDQGVDAVNVIGGMLAWAAAGLDVVTDDGSTGHVA